MSDSMDFSLIMFIALVITGMIWGVDSLLFAPRRRRRIAELRQAEVASDTIEKAAREPLLVEYSRAFFPVILLVFLLRSFLIEPFRIPSGSMLPSLLIGDFILVNKFTYGLRLPILNHKVRDIGEPHRGDIVVFRFPANPSDNYIKRVVGLPGDRIKYKEKELYVNGKLMERVEFPDSFMYRDSSEREIQAKQYRENLNGVEHAILLSADRQQEPMEFVVPAAHYFVMGDNRDYSNDSRYWGYVPEKNLVGKAFLIWFSWDAANGGGVNWSRIGSKIR